jgi:hypothetical protein
MWISGVQGGVADFGTMPITAEATLYDVFKHSLHLSSILQLNHTTNIEHYHGLQDDSEEI